MKTVAVLGGGNGAHAAAADLTPRGFAVSMWSLRPQELISIRQQGGILVEDEAGERLVPIHRTCEALPDAIAGVETILLVVPAFAHAAYAKACAPHLESGQTIILNPGSTGELSPSGKACRTMMPGPMSPSVRQTP